MSIFNAGFLKGLLNSDQRFEKLTFEKEVPDPLFRKYLKDWHDVDTIEGMKDVDFVRFDVNNSGSTTFFSRYYPKSFKGIEYCEGLLRLSLRGRDEAFEEIGRIDNLNLTDTLVIRDGLFTDPLPGRVDDMANLEAVNIQNCPNLTNLKSIIFNPYAMDSLTYVQITATGISSSIHPWFFNFPSILTLSMPNNNITGTLPNSVQNCTELTTLNLSRNSMTGYTLGGLTTQPNLAFVRFDRNELAESAVDGILSDLVESLSLQDRVTCNVQLETDNAPPSTAGEADKQTLIDAGWTVTTA